MKIFVGTLYSGENEFNDSVASVYNQDYKDRCQFIFKDLPQKEAHTTMFKDFCDSDFDILIHVGPDMVLADAQLFGNIVKVFMENPWIQHFSIMVHDFFADEMIWGLNSYHNIEFSGDNDEVFTDFIPIKKTCTIKTGKHPWAPAAYHCPNPGLFQSFHYGAHKAVKILECARRGWSGKIDYYRDILESTQRNYWQTKDKRLGLCIAGAKYGIAKNLCTEQLDYTNPWLKNKFEEALNAIPGEQ